MVEETLRIILKENEHTYIHDIKQYFLQKEQIAINHHFFFVHFESPRFIILVEIDCSNTLLSVRIMGAPPC